MAQTEVREPAVAGSFYPADVSRLRDQVDGFIAAAGAPGRSAAIIAPHAGYMYSGAVAGSAYAAIAARRPQLVVIAGPAHRYPVRGVALSGAAAYRTPFGDAMIDRTATEAVSALPDVLVEPAAHALEHSVEVQVPFVQRLFGEVPILPLVVGRSDPDRVAEVLNAVWQLPETVLVVSSDLSHYLPYDSAVARDRTTADQIVAARWTAISSDDACGAAPVRGLLATRDWLPGQIRCIDLRNSGDTAGPRDRVVGYGAFRCD